MESTIENDKKEGLTLSDNDVKYRVRTLYLEGKENKEIQKIMGINPNTWESAYYKNTHGFRDFMKEIKKERFLMQVERVSDEILAMETTNNAKMLAIKQKESEFLRETLLKEEGYTKRIETIGLNINKTEPLDDEQKEKLNKLLKKTGNEITENTDVVNKN